MPLAEAQALRRTGEYAVIARRSIILALAAAATACAPAPHPAALPRAAASLDAPVAFAAAPVDWPAADWWRRYGDPQLDALIAEGAAGAPDLAAAAARVARADATAREAGAAFGPTLGIDGSATLVKQSYNNGIPPAFVPRGWNDAGRVAASGSVGLDLWGRNRALLAAATSEAAAARIDVAAARLWLSTAIADAYADLARVYAERDVAVRAVAIRAEGETLTRDRYANGLDNLGAQRLAEARGGAARADLAAADEAIALTRNRLAALLGAGPDRGLAIARPPLPALPAAGLPPHLALDLVGRRPDIAAARARTEAAGRRIAAARAAFYPNIDLTALIGVQSLGLANLTAGGSTIGSVGPAISLPIFARGQLRAGLARAEADRAAAVADYDATLIGAVREVADAAASIRALAARRTQAEAALAAADAAWRIARQRFEGGLSPYLDVLTAEDALLERRRAATELAARAFALDIALVRALGGGFAPAPAPAAAGTP